MLNILFEENIFFAFESCKAFTLQIGNSSRTPKTLEKKCKFTSIPLGLKQDTT